MNDPLQLESIADRAMAARGLEAGYSAEARAQCQQATRPDESVRDLRSLPWCSIDNGEGDEVSSKDLDQISTARPFGKGYSKVYVAIADVDALVPQGSPADLQAQRNTATVYTAVKIYPMIDPLLSEDKTSLNEGEDRLAIVAELNLDAEGMVSEFFFYRALVRNQVALSYDAVGRWLEGGPVPNRLRGRDEVIASILLQDQAAQKLRAVRRQQGSLVLESQQAMVNLSDQSVGSGFVANRATELIENLMVASNTCASQFLRSKGFPSLQRIVRKPRLWSGIVELADELGQALPAEPDSGALARFLESERRADPVHFPDLSLKVLRLLGRGEYITEMPDEYPIGHFGLAVREYSHSTAPNRRYPDLLTQRLLKAAMAGRPCPYPRPELDDLALRCTEFETHANKVSRQVQKSAVAAMLANRVGEVFAAVISGINEQGTWVRLIDPPVEGKLGGRADLGQELNVRLTAVHVERGFLDFQPA